MDHKREDRTPQLARIMGVGRQNNNRVSPQMRNRAAILEQYTLYVGIPYVKCMIRYGV